MSETTTARQIASAVVKPLTMLLTLHHDLYRMPVSDTFAEEVLDNAFGQTRFGSIWTPGSHQVSTDITLPNANNLTLSVKSGTVTGSSGDERLNLSGSRLGKHQSSIETMVGHVKASSAEMYVCLSRRPSEWKLKGEPREGKTHKRLPLPSEDKTYHLFVFPAALLDYGQASDWVASTTGGVATKYELPYTDARRMSARIVVSMAHQLWTTVDVSLVGASTTIVIPGKVADASL